MKDEEENDELQEELIEILKKSPNYNPDLGTPKDPRYDSYKEFIDEINDPIKI